MDIRELINIFGSDVIYEITKYLDLDSILTLSGLSSDYHRICQTPKVQLIIKELSKDYLINLVISYMKLKGNLKVNRFQLDNDQYH